MISSYCSMTVHAHYVRTVTEANASGEKWQKTNLFIKLKNKFKENRSMKL